MCSNGSVRVEDALPNRSRFRPIRWPVIARTGRKSACFPADERLCHVSIVAEQLAHGRGIGIGKKEVGSVPSVERNQLKAFGLNKTLLKKLELYDKILTMGKSSLENLKQLIC